MQAISQTAVTLVRLLTVALMGRLMALFGPAAVVLLCQQAQKVFALHEQSGWAQSCRALPPAAGIAATLLRGLLAIALCGTWTSQLALLLVGSLVLCSKQHRQRWQPAADSGRPLAATGRSVWYIPSRIAAAATVVFIVTTVSREGLDVRHWDQSSVTAAAAAALQHPWLLLFVLWAGIELYNYLFIFRPKLETWNKPCEAHATPAAENPAECHALFQRFMAFSRKAPYEERCAVCRTYLSTWFKGAALEDIKQENMEELLAYGFFYRTRQQLVELGLGHLPGQMTAEFASTFNHNFPPGYTPNLKFMSHLWDDLKVAWWPLAAYAVTEVLGLSTAVCMFVMGFKRRTICGLQYYTRGIPDPGQHSSSTDKTQQQQQPVVFIHGCMGLLLYIPLLHKMAVQNTPLLVLDMKHIALRMSSRIPTIDVLTHGIAAMMSHHKLQPALVVAHSYGTLVAARLLRLHRGSVDRCLLVDPVCFGMFMPRLLYAFLYAPLKISLESIIDSVFNVLLWAITKDIHMAATFARQFYWSDVNLWPEELPRGSVVLLSGGDLLVDANNIHMLLEQQKELQVTLKPGLIHGGFLLCPNVLAEVCSNIKTLMQVAPLAAAAVMTAAAATASTTAELTEAAAAVGATAAALEGSGEDISSDNLDDVVAELRLLLPGKSQQQQEQPDPDASDTARPRDSSSRARAVPFADSLKKATSTVADVCSNTAAAAAALGPPRKLATGHSFPDWRRNTSAEGSSNSSKALCGFMVGAAADDLMLLTGGRPLKMDAAADGGAARRATVHAIAVASYQGDGVY